MAEDIDTEEIRRQLVIARREKGDLIEKLTAINAVEAGYEKLLALTERDTLPFISLRAALLQVLRASSGEPLHVKDILRQVEALGAKVNSTRGDKISRVDLGIHALKKQGYPLERVGTRTWQYLKKRKSGTTSMRGRA